MLSDKDIETMVQEKGLTAPRITPQDIEDAIDPQVQIQYHHFPGTSVTVCCVPLKNGFTVVGEAAAVSMDNFDVQLGCEVALQNAKDKMWPLLGYALREKLIAQPAMVTTG